MYKNAIRMAQRLPATAACINKLLRCSFWFFLAKGLVWTAILTWSFLMAT